VEFEVPRTDDLDLLISASGYKKLRKIIPLEDFQDKRLYPLSISLEKILIVLMDVTVRSMDYKPIYGAMVGYKGLFYETDMRGKTSFHVVNTEDCILTISCEGYKSRTYTITVDELRNKETYYLYVDLEAFQSYKAMTNDIKLVPDEYGEWDIEFNNQDFVNIGGAEALHNAIVILLLTRYGELKTNPLYKDDFGCKIHGIVKDNQNSLNKYKLEKYIEESLLKVRRISKINQIKVDDINYGYNVLISIDSLNNERVIVSLELR
jgi:phage baseplate assembly protein W